MKKIYDLVGIGIGPFNLGLAALAQSHTNLKCLFFDKKAVFNWHINMILPGTRLQVPFHADLVTLADPKSDYSFLAYLKAKRRLFRFTIREGQFPLRWEYNDYCKWVVEQLNTLRFGYSCEDISYDHQSACYRVKVRQVALKRTRIYWSRHLVIGVGTAPSVPDFIDPAMPGVFHSENYLENKHELLSGHTITIVGSGQSAAEIFNELLDLKPEPPRQIFWYTRSARFYPMDYTKFALEMTSPDYIDHFFKLSVATKRSILENQNGLYKGINAALIETIYDKLYERSLDRPGRNNVHLCPNVSLKGTKPLAGGIECSFFHHETKKDFKHGTDRLILATGYHYGVPSFLDKIRDRICWDDHGRYKVKRNYSIDSANSIFVQNAELHTHGFNTPDLGMGPYRNAIILNEILGYPYFDIESDVPFQDFGPPMD